MVPSLLVIVVVMLVVLVGGADCTTDWCSVPDEAWSGRSIGSDPGSRVGGGGGCSGCSGCANGGRSNGSSSSGCVKAEKSFC